MTLSELLNKRLILLSGKGGVGKTTVSVLLALLASRLKKKVLVIEMNSTERVAPFFGLKTIGHREIPLAPYITGINLSPRDCFEEYVLMQIRFKAIYDAFFNNRFVGYFLNAVPGLNELLMIGKIFYLEKQKDKRTAEPLYDIIIVDGPATGHGISTFEVPRIARDAIKVGPLRTQSDRILSLLKDPARTAFSVVTLAEEMPVVEAGELLTMVREKLNLPVGPIFINAVHQTDITEEEARILAGKAPEKDDPLYPWFAYASLSYQRARLNAEYREMLMEKNKSLECIAIPFQYGETTSAKGLEPIVELLAIK
ncbi:MAG: ArsA family ATPase [Deltaproteobacteria bacterium]|nr:ArsA family ATPase [Deltaproteobacteria bacterium]